MRMRPARPPGTMATFSQVYWLGLPLRCISLYRRATASLRGLMPAVGPYSRLAVEMSMWVGRWKQPAMSSSTCGCQGEGHGVVYDGRVYVPQGRPL
jgi:hypothetical protein